MDYQHKNKSFQSHKYTAQSIYLRNEKLLTEKKKIIEAL